jgi:endonuclease YncB( thermonuclease family)
MGKQASGCRAGGPVRDRARRSPIGAVLAAALLAAAITEGSPARELLPGPVPARVIQVIDGDTIVVKARIWLGQDVEIRVRLEGVDAPELAGRCERERALAARARAFLEAMLGGGEVVLSQIQYGKFAGRVVARVETPSGEDLSAALLTAGLARPYAGGPRTPWCDTAELVE